jgi:hypothetical protein
MARLRVQITADAGGWHFRWHCDGSSVGDPGDLPNHVANHLGDVGTAIAEAFEHRGSDGFGPSPSMARAALDQTGLKLRDLCCRPIAEQLDSAGTHRLTVVSDEPRALNLPWELLPVGDESMGCTTRWGIFRTPDDVPPATLGRRGPPLRIVFLAAAPSDERALDYEKEEEAILRATVKLKGAQLFTAELDTFEELDDLLQRVRPHVVHLSGHGIVGSDGVGRCCFEDEAGRADLRDANHLARLFEKRHVPCVFLNEGERVPGTFDCCSTRVKGLLESLIAPRIAGHPIDNAGMVRVAGDRYLNYHYLVQACAQANVLPVTVLRDGRTLELELPVAPGRNAWVCPPLTGNAGEPPYFIYGALAFTEARREQLNEWFREWHVYLASRKSPLVVRYADRPAFDGERLVFVVDVFPHRLVQGYTGPVSKVVGTVNDTPVRNLRHMVELLRDAAGEFVEITFVGTAPDRVIFRRAEVLRDTEAILANHDIRQQASPELMRIWQTAR